MLWTNNGELDFWKCLDPGSFSNFIFKCLIMHIIKHNDVHYVHHLYLYHLILGSLFFLRFTTIWKNQGLISQQSEQTWVWPFQIFGIISALASKSDQKISRWVKQPDASIKINKHIKEHKINHYWSETKHTSEWETWWTQFQWEKKNLKLIIGHWLDKHLLLWSFNHFLFLLLA